MRRFARVFLVAGMTAVLLGGMVGVATAVAGGGCHIRDTDTTEATGRVVQIESCAFGPTLLHVVPGTRVTWQNADRVGHAVTGINWGTGETFGPGDSVTHSFAQPGVYPYQCYLHPGMSGVVVVGAGGSMAAPAATGPQAAPVSAPDAAARGAPPTDVPGPSVAMLLAISGMTGFTGLLAGLIIARRLPRPAVRAMFGRQSVTDPAA
jgi:plastocyanin